jgi:hypothetical protein
VLLTTQIGVEVPSQDVEAQVATIGADYQEEVTMSKKLRFRIGDYVEVLATTVTVRNYRDPAHKHERRRGLYKELKRDKLFEPVRGWIVGAIRRFEGEVQSPTGGGTEDYEPGYLGVTNSKLLWKVAQSMTNVPLEVADEDVVLVAKPNQWTHKYLNDKPEWVEIPRCPLKLGTPWDTAGWSPEDQRKEMKKWPRDAKGHWLKKPKELKRP